MDKKAMKLIKKANKIYITQHIKPDGDAIGGSMALYLALKSVNKDVKVVLTQYGKRYSFIPELKETVSSIEEENYDLLICTDTSEMKRLDISEEDFNKAGKVIVFDHHKSSSIKGDVCIIDDKAPANCEILFNFFKKNKINISNRMADFLYLGLLTDTGSFNYERTTSNTYKIAATLIDKGADFVYICKKINDTYSEARLKIIAHIINNMEVYYNNKVRIATIEKADFEKNDACEHDIEGIVNYLRMIEDTEIAVVIYNTKDNEYKISIRTEGNVDGAKLAIGFGGGGHVRASGFETNDIKKAKQELLNVIGVELNGESNRDTKY